MSAKTPEEVARFVDVIAPGQLWTCNETGEVVEVLAVDDPPYPVLFRYVAGGMEGRDSIDGFLEEFSRNSKTWVAAITVARAEGHAAGVAEERERALAKIDARLTWIEERTGNGALQARLRAISELVAIRAVIASGEKP